MEPTDQNIHTTRHTNSFLDKLRSKKAVGPILLVLVLLGVLFTIQQVQKQQEVRKGAYANGANLTISASDTTPNVGDTITLTLNVVSNTIPLTGIEAHLNLPTDTFEVTNFDTTGSTFSGSLKYGPVQRGNDYNFVRTNEAETPSIGSGKIAVITAKVLRAGAFTVNYLPLTQITGQDLPNENVIDTMSVDNITVAGPVTSTTVDLKFTTTTPQVAVGQTFTVDAYMENTGNTVTAAELYVSYPNTVLQLTKFEKATLLPTIIKDAVINTVPASITVGSDTANPPTGSGVIATLTFKALQAQGQPVQILYSTNSRVAAMGHEESVLGTLTPLSISVSSAVTPGVSVTPGNDTTDPIVQFTSPTNNATYPIPGQTNVGVNVRATASDTSGIAGIKLYADNALIKDCNYMTTECSLFWNYSQKADGAIVLRAEATDRAVPANTATSTITIYKNVSPTGTVTTVPPTPTATSTPVPTNTPIAASTTLLVSLKMPTIGIDVSTENTGPVRGAREVTYQITSASGTAGAIQKANITFTNGRYVGALPIDSTLVTGSYTVKVRLDNTLYKTLGSITLTKGIANTAPLVTLISGDLALNNTLDIFDYNILISCYGARSTTIFCGNKKIIADLNDNGSVDSSDYNTLLTSFRDAVDGD